MLYPQNGDRIVAIDSVTSLNPMYSVVTAGVLMGGGRRRRQLTPSKLTPVQQQQQPFNGL